MKLKKTIAIITIATLAAASLAGCGNEKTASKGGASLTWWCKNNANAYIDSYNNVGTFQLMQEKTGTKVTFEHPVVGQEAEQFNVLIASGDYPDLIEYDWSKYPGGAIKAVSDGVIISLDEYINEEKMPNLTKLLNENPEYLKVTKNADGSISTFPSLVESSKINAFFGPTIRKDWLDKLNLKMPETIDDWHTVLTAFKTQDPNGNGQADEVPFVDDSLASCQYFAAAFGAGTGMLLNKSGKVVYSPMTDEFKNYLSTMHQWYEEGLIDHDYASQNRKSIDYKMTADIGGSYIGYTGSQMGNYVKAKENDSSYKLSATQWPKGNDGKAYCGNEDMKQVKNPYAQLAITSSNKNVDETIALIDWLYSDEGAIAKNYGIEGKSYTKTDNGLEYTDEIMHNSEGKDPVAALVPYAIPIWGFSGTVMLDDAYDKISRSYDEQKEAASLWREADTSLLLPPLAFTAEESEVISNVWNDVHTCTQEYFAKVILGSASTDNFDTYVSQLKTMGVDKVVEVYQAAYDRYMNN